MKRNTILTRVVPALVAMGALGALSVMSATAAPAHKSATKLTIWTWDVDQQKTGDATFAKNHSDITLNYVKLATADLYQKMQLAAASGSGLPDVVLLEDSHIAQIAKLGVLADITSLATKYKKKFVAAKWQQNTLNGKIYGFPWDIGPVAMYYRRDILQKAGVNPNSLTTWAKWIAAGSKIKAATGADLWYQAKAQNDGRFFETLLWQQGSGYINAKGAVTLDKDPRALAALNLLGDGWKKGVLGDVPEWGDPWYKGINTGQVATLPMAAWMGGFLESWLAPDGKGKWGVVKLPAFKAGGSRSANDGGSDLAITKTADKTAAWAYVQNLLANPAVQAEVWKRSGFFPSLLQSWNSTFTTKADPYFGGQAIQKVFAEAAKAIPAAYVYSADYQQMNSVMNAEIQKFALGKETAQQA
ncbi:MAG: lactose/L-arabinose transport system substrate-binding protein, partial [Gaiellaceae bacterium]|nr:lactose/L-arabinose transport system substrate-binding protein [Gaiellaceae bacterium]